VLVDFLADAKDLLADVLDLSFARGEPPTDDASFFAER